MPRTILAAEALVPRCDVTHVQLPAGFGHCQPVLQAPLMFFSSCISLFLRITKHMLWKSPRKQSTASRPVQLSADLQSTVCSLDSNWPARKILKGL